MHRLILILVCSYFMFNINGKLHPQTPDLNLEYVNATFPNLSGANVIYQDSQGFLWFGTGDGLKKFDGYQVITFRNNPTDSLSLSENNITAILEDPDFNLWIGTINGLNKLNPETGKCFRYYHSPDNPLSLSDNYITALCLDNTGFLWVGTQTGGLNVTLTKTNNGDSLAFFHHLSDSMNTETLSSNYIRFISNINKDKLLIGTEKGLNIYDRHNRSFKHYRSNSGTENGLINDDLWSLYCDINSDFWIGASDGWLSKIHFYEKDEIYETNCLRPRVIDLRPS